MLFFTTYTSVPYVIRLRSLYKEYRSIRQYIFLVITREIINVTFHCTNFIAPIWLKLRVVNYCFLCEQSFTITSMLTVILNTLFNCRRISLTLGWQTNTIPKVSPVFGASCQSLVNKFQWPLTITWYSSGTLKQHCELNQFKWLNY